MELHDTMQAMVLEQPEQPLILKTLQVPSPSDNQVLVKIIACGVCRTDLHIIDGELANPKLPLIPGHEIVGRVVKTGKNVNHVLNMISSEFHGWVIPAENVNFACKARRISAKKLFLPVIQLTAVMQNMQQPMSNTVSHFLPYMAMHPERHYFVQGLSVTVPTI